jgi:hypothetical protein
VSGRKHREPTSDVLFVESEGFTCNPDERVENRAPSNLIVVERVVEMARTDWVLGQDQRAIIRVPDRERLISDELCKAVRAPSLLGRCDHGNVSGIEGHNISYLVDEICAIVQAAIPGNHRAGGGNMRLRLAT